MGSLYVSDPWLKCEPFKGTLNKGEHLVSLYKESGSSSPPLHDQKTILAEKVAFWKDDIHTMVVLEVRSKLKLKPQKKKKADISFRVLAVASPHTPVTVTH